MPVAAWLALAAALAVPPGPGGAAAQQAGPVAAADLEREAREKVAAHLRREDQARRRLGTREEPRFRNLAVHRGPRWVVVCGEVGRGDAPRGYTRFVQPFDASRQALREHGRPRAADTHVEDEFGDDQFWREQFGQLWSERWRS